MSSHESHHEPNPAPADLGSYRSRKQARRAERRARVAGMTQVPVPERLKAFDPLERSESKSGGAALLGVGLVVGAVALHALILGMFVGVSAVMSTPPPPKDDPITVAIIDTPDPPPPEPEVKEPEPEPEPEPEVKEPEPEIKEPEPEPEPEVKKPDPPKKKKPKPPPKKQPKELPVADKEPPPQAADPINEPPKDPPKEQLPVRIGLNMESTVDGGKGGSFATGSTRMGTTDRTAGDPNQKLGKGSPKGVANGTGKNTENKVATRIPVDKVKYTKPSAKGGMRKPPYPAMLRRRNIEGDVVVLVTVSPAGTVTNVKIVKPAKYPEFNAAALAQARKQTFNPAMKIEGSKKTPVAYNIKYTYRFRLNN